MDPSPFDLDEYASASVTFFTSAVRAVVRSGDGLLGQVGVEEVEALTPMQSTLESGEIVAFAPVAASSLVTMTISEGVAGNFDEIHGAVAQLAAEHEAQVVPKMIEHISAICEGTGNVVDGAGMSIWEAQLEMLETIEIVFDSDGTPSLPQLLVNPETAAKMGDPPDGFAERFEAIIERRRDEWMAGRRTRRLPRPGH